jgi:hypothetical protein
MAKAIVRPAAAGPRLAARYTPLDPSPRQRVSIGWVAVIGVAILLGAWGGLGWVSRQWSPAGQVHFIQHGKTAKTPQRQDSSPPLEPKVRGRLVG